MPTCALRHTSTSDCLPSGEIRPTAVVAPAKRDRSLGFVGLFAGAILLARPGGPAASAPPDEKAATLQRARQS
jgi:hypothetical protein